LNIEIDLVLPPQSLVVFVDETGHEDLASGHPMYGLGGCAVLDSRLDWDVRQPWRELRREILGNPDAPMHASEITRQIDREKMALIGSFFEVVPFMRLAVALTVKTAIPDPIERLQVVAPCLVQRIVDVLNWTTDRSVSVIFESNERNNPKIQRYFNGITIGEEAKNVPIELYFMPKSAKEPGLEIADFIMHAVHGLAKTRLEGAHGYDRLDFKSVFQSVDSKLASFMLLDNVTYTPHNAPEATSA